MMSEIDPWEVATEEAENADTGLFCKIANGNSVEVVFCGNPLTFQCCYVDKKAQPVTEALVAKGYRVNTRFRFNVWVPSKNIMQIFEVSPSLMKSIIACRNEYGLDRFGKILFKISRQGIELKTTYQIMYKKELTADEFAVVSGQPLHPLEFKAKADADVSVPPPPPARPAPAPQPTVSSAPPAAGDVFEQNPQRSISELVAFCRTVSRDLVEAMKKQFGVQKVSLLPESKVEEAFAFLEDDMF